jgi:hypothetical protein
MMKNRSVPLVDEKNVENLGRKDQKSGHFSWPPLRVMRLPIECLNVLLRGE